MRDPKALDTLLSAFKATELAEYVHGILYNMDAKRVISAWMTYPVKWSPPAGEVPKEDPRTLWDWIWSGCVVDMDSLASASGLRPYEVEDVFELVRRSRLIYPDGTVATHALALIRVDVRKVVLPNVPRSAPDGGSTPSSGGGPTTH